VIDSLSGVIMRKIAGEKSYKRGKRDITAYTFQNGDEVNFTFSFFSRQEAQRGRGPHVSFLEMRGVAMLERDLARKEGNAEEKRVLPGDSQGAPGQTQNYQGRGQKGREKVRMWKKKVDRPDNL